MHSWHRMVIAVSVVLTTTTAKPESAMRGEVVGITDGDTLTLLVDRTQHKIRLAQIDTPGERTAMAVCISRPRHDQCHTRAMTMFTTAEVGIRECYAQDRQREFQRV